MIEVLRAQAGRAAGVAGPALAIAGGLLLLDRVLEGERDRLARLQAQAAALAEDVDQLQRALGDVDPRQGAEDPAPADADTPTGGPAADQ